MSLKEAIAAAPLRGLPGCRLLALYAQAGGGAIEMLIGPVDGEPPPADLVAAADGMAASGGPPRPGARRLAHGHLVRVPLQAPLAHLWWIEDEGAGFSAATIKALVKASTRLAGMAAGPRQAAEAPGRLALETGRLLAELAALPRARGGRRLRQALDAIGQATGWTGVAAIEMRGAKARRITMLEARPGTRPPSLRIFAERLRAKGETFLAASPAGPIVAEAPGPPGLAEAQAGFVGPDAGQDHGPDLALYCQEHGLERFAIALPKGDGLGLYVEGGGEQLLIENALHALALRAAPPRRGRRPWLGRAALATLVSAALVFLALPAPFEIGAPAELRPADARVVVVQHEARLVELPVRAGDLVAEGTLLARLVSTALEEAEARATLDQLLEGLAAQEALAAGDYARYQLAEQRREIAALKVEQGRRRLDELTLQAPASGRVADLIPRGQLGALLPAGAVIAEIETGERPQALLQVAASDGPHLRAGMEGRVVVRGLVDRRYTLRLLEDPLVQERDDGSRTLTVLGEIEAEGSAELFKGLTGFARIAAGEQPRLLTLIRPLSDYLGLFLWRHLGLRL